MGEVPTSTFDGIVLKPAAPASEKPAAPAVEAASQPPAGAVASETPAADSATEVPQQPEPTPGVPASPVAPSATAESANASPLTTGITEKDTTKQVSPPQKDEKPAEAEDNEKLVGEAWQEKDGAVDIVESLDKAGALSADTATIAQQLQVEASDPKVAAEIERRKQVQEALAIMRAALNPNSVYLRNGEFQTVDKAGHTIQVRTHRAVMPIIGQLRIVAQDPKNQSAARAKAILDVLEPRIVEARPGEYFFDKTKNLEHRRAAEAVGLAWEVLEFRLRQLGEALPHEGTRVNVSELEELVKKHDPNGEIGRLGLLLVDYSRLDPYDHSEARAFNSALIYQALKSLNVGQISTRSEFAQRFRDIAKNDAGFDSQLTELERRIVLAAHLDPREVHIGHYNLLTVAVFGYGCNQLVERDTKFNRLRLPQNIESSITSMFTGGRFIANERDVILSLAMTDGSAEGILGNTLQLNLEALKEDHAAITYAADAVDGIDAQRIARGESPLKSDTAGNYRRAMQHDLEISLQQAQKEKRLGGIFTVLGLMGVIFLPTLQGVASYSGSQARGQAEEE